MNSREDLSDDDLGAKGTEPKDSVQPREVRAAVPSPEPPNVPCECGHVGADHTPINPATHQYGCRVDGCVCMAWTSQKRGVVHLQGHGESETVECIGTAPVQYSAICKHALWMIGSCPECHGEATQYKGPIGPPHPIEDDPRYDPSKPDAGMSGPAVARDPENDYAASPTIMFTTEIGARKYTKDPPHTHIVRSCPHCHHEIHIEVETYKNTGRKP